MRLLDNAVIRDHYDVVIVGAGVGGLTAAGLLAKRGLNVLLLEQHYLPGGCCTAIRRNDVAMDVGAALLFGWMDEKDPHRFVMNELEEQIDMIPHESTYRMHLGKKSVTFWRDLDRYLDELTEVFPHQEKEIRALYRYARDIYEKMIDMNRFPVAPTELPPIEGIKTALKAPLTTIQMQRLMKMSGQDVVNKFITDPRVANFFDFLVAVLTCCNVDESSALIVLNIIIGTHLGGACYPSGSPQKFPDKLEKAIEKYGGQIVYRKMVEEVLIWKNKAYGVRLDDGTEITADSIVSNADIWRLYGTLIKDKHIKPERKEWAQKFDPTPGVFILYMSVKEEAIPEGARAIEFFVDNVHDVLGGNYIVYIPSIDDPSIAPPGTHSLTVMSPTDFDWPRPHDRFYQSEEYYKIKEEESEKILDKLQNNFFPKLKDNIMSLDIGTPTTLERFTLKSFGNLGGPKFTLKQFIFDRLRARSDWENLYCVGDSTSMGEGVVSACISGVGAANQILKDKGLPTYRPREYPRSYVNLIEGKLWTPSPDPTEPISEESAMRIGRDCQHCQEPECRNACPANIETSLFARRIESGNFAGAARVLREVNPLSEVCGAICPAERFCEKKCSRLDFSDRPVRIRELHGWVCGHVSKHEGWDRSVAARNGRKVAVVGAGPAGLTCAHYLARLGYQVNIMDKAKGPGGMLMRAVPDFRLPGAVVEREIEGLSLPGMTFQYGKALGKDFTVEDLQAEHHAVFLAPGLWSGRTFDIPGLEKGKMTDGLSFLLSCRGNGKGKVGNSVVVVGGGSVASDAAVSAKRLGAKKVTLVCLESREEMPCLKSEFIEMNDQGVKIENGWGPKAAPSNSSLAFHRCTSVFDKSGAFRPVFDESETMELGFDQVILAVGQQVEPALAKYLKKAFGREDRVEVDTRNMQVVGRSRVFAGGDIVRGAGTVVEAVGDGRRAAAAIDELVKDDPGI